MCLDRLGRTQEATPYFRTAIRNDPHNCYIALEVGRHCIAMGELTAAKKWLSFDGAMKVASTDVADAEYTHLEQLMADPLYVAAAALIHTNQSPTRAGAMADPLLEGPK
jgi:hypothetical protein